MVGGIIVNCTVVGGAAFGGIAICCTVVKSPVVDVGSEGKNGTIEFWKPSIIKSNKYKVLI